MKKLIIICLILFCCANVYGQQDGINLGIKGGMNWASLTGKDLDSLSNGGDAKALSGQIIGITFSNKMSKYFWLKHDLFYSRRFMTIQIDDGVNPPFTSNLKRTYIDIFPASPTLQFKGLQIYAGPYIGILLSASLQRKNANGNLYTDKSFFGDSETLGVYSQKFDAGIVAGIEYEFPVGINIGAKYIRGFIPLLEDAGKQQQWRIYNQSFSVTLGYTIIK